MGALADMLQGHQPQPGPETKALERIQCLLKTPAPFSRNQYQPGHLTASAIVVNQATTEALLLFHSKLERWLQPGGHFEPEDGGDPQQAAAREVFEETGLETEPGGALLDVDVHEIPARKAEPTHEHFDLRLLLVATSESAQVGDGAREVRWVEPSGFAELDLDPGLLRALSKVDWKR